MQTSTAAVASTGNLGTLTPQAYTVWSYLNRNAEGLSAYEAMLAFQGMTSATLARRVCDLEEAGFRVARLRKRHPVSGKQYTRYQLVKG
jgi:hypothetical protein